MKASHALSREATTDLHKLCFTSRLVDAANLPGTMMKILLALMLTGYAAGLRGKSLMTLDTPDQLHRQEQGHPIAGMVSAITGFQWIDPKTNKAIQIDGSELVQHGKYVDLGEAPPGLTIEALVVGAPIGSVRFQVNSLGSVEFVDNEGRFFACGNKGADVLPCNFASAPTSITARIYSGPNATGNVLSERNVVVNFFAQLPPMLKLTLIAPGKPERPLTNNMVISLALTPAMSVRMDYDGYKNWNPQSAVFNYDKRTIVRTENNAPFALLGNRGGNYTMFTPAIGRHKLVVTAYSQKNAKSQSTQKTVSFTVTK
jgi:hypothetical protein